MRRFGLSGDLQLLMLSNLVEATTRFGAFVLYSRALSAAGLGLVASMTALAHLTNHLLQLGVDTSVISLGSKAYGAGDRDRLTAICRAGFSLQLLVGLVLAAFGLACTPLLARHLYQDPAVTPALIAAFAGVPLVRLSRYVMSVLSTHQRFRHYALATASSTVTLFAAVAVLYGMGRLSVLNVVALTLIVSPLVQLVVGVVGIPARIFFVHLPPRELISQLMDFGKWVWGTALLSSGVRRINVILLTAIAGPTATGYFQMGRRYAEFLSLIFEPLRRYLIPKLTSLAAVPEVMERLRGTYRWLAWTLLLLPVAWILAGPVILTVQGPEWEPAVVLFRILVVSRLLLFLAEPLTFALFSFGRPHVQTYVQATAFVGYLVGAALVIPRYEALGSALLLAGVAVFTLVAFSLYVRRVAVESRRH